MNTLEIIKSKNDQCTGCNRCVRECPMEIANITNKNEAGYIKVEIDYDKCIVCGRCVSACKHDARHFADDTEQFFADLSRGIPISIIVAPSIKTNIPEYKTLFTTLKRLGLNNIYDVSLGADICIWAHMKLIEQKESIPMITQPCPSIVRYIELYRHDLISNLSPVHSPMACTSIYMKKYKGIKDRIAALSPCMAKKVEFQDTQLIDYNITFKHLLEYLKRNNIVMPDEETQYDNENSGLGSLFPMPGGLKENIEFFIGNKMHIASAEGFEIYDKLNLYAQTSDELLPHIYDVLSCTEGCNLGSAYSHDRSMFEIDKTMDVNRKKVTDEQKRENYVAAHEAYNNTFDITHFIREYRLIHTPYGEVTEAEITEAYNKLGKNDYEKQHIDCEACGSDTCYAMARKIALNVNIPENCIIKSKEDAKAEHEANLRAYRKLAEMEKKLETDARMRTLIDSCPLAAHFWDENCNLLDCNQAAYIFFGLSGKQDYLEKYFDLTPQYQPDGEPSKDKLRYYINKTIKDGMSRIEFMRKSLDGETIPMETTLVRVQLGGRTLVASYCRDLREHKIMMQELDDARKELEHQFEVAQFQRLAAEEATRAKSAFLSNVSHEMRTPMNAIMGMMQIIDMRGAPDNLQEYLGNIDNATRHLLSMIDDVLDVAGMEYGSVKLSDSAIDIGEMFRVIHQTTQHNASLKQQKLEFHIDPSIPASLRGDERHLKQVIHSLLGNAIKFTPEQGEVRLDVRLIEELGEEVTIQFDITDTGIGIAADQVDSLFEIFKQLDDSYTKRYAGIGIGLALSKRIVELMGGEIWVETELNEGAKFSFTCKLKKI